MLDDIHLLADVVLPTDVVAGREELRTKFENEILKETGFAILEYVDFAQGRQVSVDRYIGLELVRQRVENLLLVERMIRRPQIVEPLYDARLHVLAHVALVHVLLDAVHAILKLVSRRVHVRYRVADVADDRREDEHADEKVEYDESVLGVGRRFGRFADRRQGLRRPVETVDVFASQIAPFADWRRIDPAIGAVTDRLGESEVDARVPVDADHDVEDETRYAKDVWEADFALGFAEEEPHAMDFEETVETKGDGARARCDVEDVEG